MKKFLLSLKKMTDGWWIKEKLKPFYLPMIHRLMFSLENQNFKKKGFNVLLKADQAFSELGIIYWLEFGTLLGYYRDGMLISHDTDIDVGVFLSDYSPKIETILKKHGFRKTRKFEIEGGSYGLEESYELNGVSFDIFYFTKTDEGMYCHLFPLDENKNHQVRELHTTANTFKEVDWNGNKVHIPENTHQRLEDTYGNYKIKIKGWHTPSQALNSRIIDKSCTSTKY